MNAAQQADWFEVEAGYGIRLAHKTLPIWVVEYPAVEGVRPAHFEGYIATAKLIRGQHPAQGGVDNRRVGKEGVGFPNAEQAMQAAIARATA